MSIPQSRLSVDWVIKKTADGLTNPSLMRKTAILLLAVVPQKKRQWLFLHEECRSHPGARRACIHADWSLLVLNLPV